MFEAAKRLHGQARLSINRR